MKVSGTEPKGPRFAPPPSQKNLARATELGFQALRGQTPEQLAWLGVEVSGDQWKVPVLNEVLTVDVAVREVTTPTGEAVGPAWRILILHYLAVGGRPIAYDPEITFADLETARSYNKVYQGRTVGRLCATAGRDEARLRAAADAIGGRPVAGGDAAYDFDMFPRLRLRLVWHAPDEEFPASATILLPQNIESFFCAEDTVVLSECLVSRLCGKPF
jgi:hypothetical protein